MPKHPYKRELEIRMEIIPFQICSEPISNIYLKTLVLYTE